MSLSLPPVILVDTSVLCALLKVPNRDSEAALCAEMLKQYVAEQAALLLPMATLLETGNHIAQNGDERQRLHTAKLFVALVEDGLRGRPSPFAVAKFPDEPTLRKWLAVFPEKASHNAQRRKGLGLGDVSILDEYERQCAQNPRRLVRIWTLDHGLRRERPPASRM